MLYPSRYNHLVTVTAKDGEQKRILSNLFFGGADFLNQDLYEVFEDSEKSHSVNEARLSGDALEHFTGKGYLWPEAEAEEQMIQGMAHTYGDRDQIAAGLKGGHYGFITSLHCNLDCPYCFQKTKADTCGYLTLAQADLGLEAIARCEARVSELCGGMETLPKISITGGEPLLRTAENLAVLNHLIRRLDELHWPFSITSNGTELASFVEDYEPMKNCRNIQVTLDGPRSVHDERRSFRGGRPSFDRICEGIGAALSSGWKLTLRVNLDMANVTSIPELAAFIQEQAWTEYESFSAYVSPVTDHGAIGGYDTPHSEADLLSLLLQVVEKTPTVREVFDIRHFRGFNYVERILLQNAPRFPVIFRCEAVTGMYIFDPMGDVHVCLEAAGDRTLRVGAYDPVWKIDEEQAVRWSHRTVLGISKCNGCKIRFICSGGCAMESFNHQSGCMPFLEEIDSAWHYYARTRPELFE